MKFKSNIEVQAGIEDKDGQVGSSGQILASTGSQVDWIDQSTLVSGSAERVSILVKNGEGTALVKGDPVYIIGSVGASARLEVGLCDASDSSKMPCVGLLEQDLLDNGEGTAVTAGKLRNLVTTPIDGQTTTENDTIYVKAGGSSGSSLTTTKPTGSTNLIQNVGQVGRVSTSSDGNFVVSAIMRTNDVPNLPEGRIWVGDGNTIVSDTVYIDEPNERMGIGTTSPSRLLDVDGIQGWSEGTNVEKAYLNPTGTGTDFNLLGDNGDIRFDSRAGSNSYINTGNVGIGTTSPSYPLDVTSSSLIGVEVESNYAGSSGIRVKRTSGDSVSLLANYTGYGGGISSTDALRFQVNATNADSIDSPSMYIETNGNVGIGTTSPSEKLEVDGIIKVVHTDDSYAKYRGQGVFFSRSNSYLAPEQDNFASLLIGYNGARWGNVEINGAFIKFENGPNEFMRIASSGNVGIGTPSPLNRLQVSGGSVGIDSEYMIRDNKNNTILLQSPSTAVSNRSLTVGNATYSNVTIPSGNVGIGTTSPGAKLDISTTGTGDSMIIRNDDASSSAAPVFVLKRDSSSPANGDYLGQLKFKGENDAGQEIVYAKITAKISDVTDGTEDGLIETAVKSGGSNLIVSRQTGTDLKLINGVGLEVDGDASFEGDVTANGYLTLTGQATPQLFMQSNTSGTPNWTLIAGTNGYFTIGRAGVANDFYLDPSGNATFAGNVSLPDNKNIKLGAGQDLELFHSGSHSYIQNSTGDLEIINYADDKDIVFKCDDGSGGTTTYLTLDGGDGNINFYKNISNQANANLIMGGGQIKFADAGRLYIGDSNDLQIYHDGSNSYIQDTGTGSLILVGTDLQLKSAGDEFFMYGAADGQVALYHNGTKKFETTSTGVIVTGTAAATTFSGDLNGTINTATTAVTKANANKRHHGSYYSFCTKLNRYNTCWFSVSRNLECIYKHTNTYKWIWYNRSFLYSINRWFN